MPSCFLKVFFGLGDLFYRKCVFCIHKEVGAACLCVVVYSMSGDAAWMLGIRD